MNVAVWYDVFRILRRRVPRFRYPKWFAFLAKQIPNANSRARRDVPRFLSLLEAVAWCRSFADGRAKDSAELEIDFADYCVAYQILSDAFTSTYVGVHPMALRFSDTVRELCRDDKARVTTKAVAQRLGWKVSLAHKWRVDALRHRLIRYQEGTHPSNEKPLLPGPTENVTGFLPDPQLVFRERPDVGDVVQYIDPLNGEVRVMRRVGIQRTGVPKRKKEQRTGN